MLALVAANAQRLDIRHGRTYRFLVKEDDRIERLILRAGGGIFFGQSGEEPFQFLFT